MIVNHYGAEFGYELIAALPFAYWLHQNGELTKTVSCDDTKCLYYFSENHEETIPERRWNKFEEALRKAEIPNLNIHKPRLDSSRWSPPPLNEYYKNDIFDYDYVVMNKYNNEWYGYPQNFIPTDVLDKVFTKLSGKKVLYFHMTKDMGRDDSWPSLELNEWDIVKRYNIDTIQDVMKKHDYSLNHLQCLIYANCSQFISIAGGCAILASYFGGRNIIYAVDCPDIHSGELHGYYPNFSGSDIHVVSNGVDLCNLL